MTHWDWYSMCMCASISSHIREATRTCANLYGGQSTVKFIATKTSLLNHHILIALHPLLDCITEWMKSERVTGRWWGSSTNLRLALLKMYQGQIEDGSGSHGRLDELWKARKSLSFRFGQPWSEGWCSCKHPHKHKRDEGVDGVNCLNVLLRVKNVPMSIRDERKVKEGKAKSPTERWRMKKKRHADEKK